MVSAEDVQYVLPPSCMASAKDVLVYSPHVWNQLRMYSSTPRHIVSAEDALVYSPPRMLSAEDVLESSPTRMVSAEDVLEYSPPCMVSAEDVLEYSPPCDCMVSAEDVYLSTMHHCTPSPPPPLSMQGDFLIPAACLQC